MGELKIKMEEEMSLQGLRPRSRKGYLYASRDLVKRGFSSPSPLVTG